MKKIFIILLLFSPLPILSQPSIDDLFQIYQTCDHCDRIQVYEPIDKLGFVAKNLALFRFHPISVFIDSEEASMALINDNTTDRIDVTFYPGIFVNFDLQFETNHFGTYAALLNSLSRGVRVVSDVVLSFNLIDISPFHFQYGTILFAGYRLDCDFSITPTSENHSTPIYRVLLTRWKNPA